MQKKYIISAIIGATFGYLVTKRLAKDLPIGQRIVRGYASVAFLPIALVWHGD